MNKKEENAYIQGCRATWNKVLSESLKKLGYNNSTTTLSPSWILEREAIIVQLRELCSEFGDNDWDEKLHLADVIEKHLGRYLHSWGK